jgi:hypothetical protein
VTKVWKDRSFLDLLLHMKKEHNALLIGVASEDRILVNPTDYVFKGDEDVVLIAAGEVRL